MSRREEPVVNATQRGESSERLEATQRGPAVGGEIDEHDSRRQGDGRRGGGGARDVWACGVGVVQACGVAVYGPVK